MEKWKIKMESFSGMMEKFIKGDLKMVGFMAQDRLHSKISKL